jgi:hypothetical protein
LRAFAKQKDASGCRQTAEMWERLERKDADSLYSTARFRAVTASVLRTNWVKAGELLPRKFPVGV